MKTELLILLILDVFDAVTTEFRHHQERYAKDNFTAYPWFSSHKGEEKTVTEITKLRAHQGVVTSHDQTLDVIEPLRMNSLYEVSEFLKENRDFYPTKSVFNTDENEKETEKKGKVYFLNEENKSSKLTNKFMELETSTRSFSLEKSNFYFLNPSLKKKRNELELSGLADSHINNLNEDETYNKSRKMSEKINFPDPSFTEKSVSHSNEGYSEQNNDLNLFRETSDVLFAQPLVALTDTLEYDGCVENVVEDFTVSDDLVTGDVLTDRNEAQKLTAALVVTWSETADTDQLHPWVDGTGRLTQTNPNTPHIIGGNHEARQMCPRGTF